MIPVLSHFLLQSCMELDQIFPPIQWAIFDRIQYNRPRTFWLISSLPDIFRQGRHRTAIEDATWIGICHGKKGNQSKLHCERRKLLKVNPWRRDFRTAVTGVSII